MMDQQKEIFDKKYRGMGILLLYLDESGLKDEDIRKIKTLCPNRKLLISKDQETINANLERIEISAGRLPCELIIQAPSIRWVQQWYAGTDWLLKHPEAKKKDFILTNVSGVHAIPISEHILSFLLSFSRRLKKAIINQEKKLWDYPGKEDTFELAGKTVLLLGTGAIGSRTAQILSAIGVRVWGVRRNPNRSISGMEKVIGPEELKTLLPEADFVVNTLPLTAETLRIIDEPELRAMKKTAYLINIGRGATINQDVLVKALQDDWIAGAGLDCFVNEPLPKNSKLWGMKNVVITCHYSGLTPCYEERAMSIFLNNLERYQKGEPLCNMVDLQLGY